MKHRLFCSCAFLAACLFLSLPAQAMEKGGAAPEDNPALQSPLTYEGATTIGFKIMPEAAKTFAAKAGVAFGAIGEGGAGAGFKAVVEGKVSLGGLASAMSDQQKAAVAAWQIIGYDTMGVFVHPDNPVKALSMAQLKDIFSGKITNWKDVGGADQPITVHIEPLASGRATVSAFKGMVLGADTAYGPVKEHEDPLDCILAVEKYPGGIAPASIAIATKKVAAVALDGALPDRAAVQADKYPLKRPLSLITMMPSGNVQKFFEFMLSPEGQAIVGKDFVPVK